MIKDLQYYKNLATETHHGLYTYNDWTVLGKYHDKIKITCVTHGNFSASLANHITKKSGCPVCRAENRSNGLYRRHSIPKWIEKSIAIHGSLYDYSLIVEITNTSIDTSPIICSEHGVFHQTLASHVDKKAGCPKCKKTNVRNTSLEKYGVHSPKLKNLTSAQYQLLCDANWIREQHLVHHRTIMDIAVEIGGGDTCLGQYFTKYNIPTQRFAISAGERAIFNFISQHIECVSNDRTILPAGRELDIFIPSLKIAIEYCGLYWHSDRHKASNYHKDKMEQCNTLGIRLITLFEDEWELNQRIVEEKLLSIIGKDNRPKIYARKCVIQPADKATKTTFFNSNHIQGDGPSSIQLGLYYEQHLVACIAFINKGNGVYVLNRYATSNRVIGGFSKLLQHFKKNFEWRCIETFADLRWSCGDLYDQTAFERLYTIPPDYSWSNGKVRYHKFGFRRKHLSTKLTKFDPNLTEEANCKQNGLMRVFDCGKVKFSIVNKS